MSFAFLDLPAGYKEWMLRALRFLYIYVPALSMGRLAGLSRLNPDRGACMRKAVILLLSCCALRAVEQPIDPILSIETGFHTLRISGIDATTDGKVLVSASEDKTLRTWQWDGQSIEPLAVYRMPFGPGMAGALGAVAISPDGRWLVAGGWSGVPVGSESVYIIDRQSGQITCRVSGMTGSILGLRVAPRGDAVLVCQGVGAGICCLSLPDGHLKWRDMAYGTAFQGATWLPQTGADCRDACWLPDGGCVTTSQDGRVRRYDSQGQLIAHIEAPHGKQPAGLDHQDGVLAVGYYDTAAVSLLRADTLAPLSGDGCLDASGVGGGGLGRICAAHGRWWAAGMAAFLGGPRVLSWPAAVGPQQQHAQFAGSAAISGLRPLPAGILASSDTPWLCVLATTGEIQASLEPRRWNFTGALLSDAEGRRVFSQENLHLDLASGTAARLNFRQWMWVTYAAQPQNPENAFSMVWNLLDEGEAGEPRDPQTAEELARAALAMPDADMPGLRDALAEALFQLNRFAEARSEAGEAVRLAKAQDPPEDDNVLSSYVERLSRITAALKEPALAAIPPRREPFSSASHNHFEHAITETPGLELQTTEFAATINGLPIPLAVDERVYVHAIAPDGRLMVLGSNLFLTAMTPTGIELWRQALASEPRSLVCPSKAPVAILSFPDGTIQWYRLSDGAKVLTCFVHSDAQRWVAWTPRGYYWAGPGSEDLIGWQVSRGPNQLAEFFPTSRFADRFNRPDVVKQVLATWKSDSEIVKDLGVSDSIAAAVQGVPVVRITAPIAASEVAPGTEQTTVEAEVQNTGGGIDEVRVLVNGKALDGTGRGLRPQGAVTISSYRWEIPVAPGFNEIRITAFNSQRTESHPAIIQISCPERKATSTLYGIAIAVGAYENPKYRLDWTIADAQAVMEAISHSGKTLFGSVQWTPLLDTQVSKVSLQAAFAGIQGKAKPEDTLVVFYAGHGVMSEGSPGTPGSFYLIPPTIRQLYGHDDDLAANAISAADLRDWCKAIPAQKQVLFLDACESGSAVETVALRGASEERALAQLSRSAGISIIAAAGSAQGANEIKALGHGVFTYALLEGLSGKARTDDRPVTVRSLDAWLGHMVPELTKRYRANMQIPTSCHRGQDFPLTLP